MTPWPRAPVTSNIAYGDISPFIAVLSTSNNTHLGKKQTSVLLDKCPRSPAPDQTLSGPGWGWWWGSDMLVPAKSEDGRKGRMCMASKEAGRPAGTAVQMCWVLAGGVCVMQVGMP